MTDPGRYLTPIGKFGIHALLPGLTGWAQINGRDELPIPVKVGFDCGEGGEEGRGEALVAVFSS